ncbi:MAG: hypothetical protein Q7T03_01275 [Deltaproteobacteria bacterium]|nr:hypothetical protein [Deltaproteobacteria bacterium]
MDYQTRLYQTWSPMKRLEAAAALYKLAKEIIRTREKRLHPLSSEQELEQRVRSFFR